MAARKQSEKKMVKLEAALAIGFIALLLGFFAGTIYSGKQQGDAPQYAQKPVGIPQQQPAVQQGPSPEMLNAVKLLEDRVAANPQDASSLTRLANLYFDTNQLDKAIDAYKKVLEIDPRNANIWTDLGVMYLRNGKPQDAIASFDKAIAIDPRHEQSRFNKGIVLSNELRDYAGAIAAWEELVKINPNATGPGGETVQTMIEHLKNAIAGPK